jgi:hypothetical protein
MCDIERKSEIPGVESLALSLIIRLLAVIPFLRSATVRESAQFGNGFCISSSTERALGNTKVFKKFPIQANPYYKQDLVGTPVTGFFRRHIPFLLSRSDTERYNGTPSIIALPQHLHRHQR